MATSLVGRRLGKYEIQAEIGRGGMGVVYRGYDPALQRVVAVKVLPPQLAMDPDFVRRFHREAVMAAQLKHPNIVTIHDVGEHEDFHFIVMEYLEGSPLDRWLTSGLLGVDQVNRVVRQVADALDFAHKRGVVHRDIKPSNIMVSNDGHVTLMDFGLVRATEGTVLTMSGAVMGTPEYMAPEQAQGQPTDHRADIYAFGIVIYRLLVGRLPFERTTAPALIHAHVYEAPPPLRQLRPDLSRVVEAVVLKAIAKQPTDRYQSAGQLAREFEAAIGGKADAGLAAPTAPPAARQPASKMPILIGLLLLLLVAAVGGAWLITSPPETPTATPAPTVVVKTGDEVTPAPTLTPTNTLAPATDTPLPLAAAVHEDDKVEVGPPVAPPGRVGHYRRQHLRRDCDVGLVDQVHTRHGHHFARGSRGSDRRCGRRPPALAAALSEGQPKVRANQGGRGRDLENVGSSA